MSLRRAHPLALAVLSLAVAGPVVAQSPPTFAVTAVVFSPDGRTLITAGADGNVCFRDSDGKEQLTLPAHERGVTGLALSSDGKVLASAGGDHAVRLWDVTCCLSPDSLDDYRKKKVRIDRLLADLNADAFEVRDKALTELRALGSLAAPFLVRARAPSSPPEVRYQARLLLDQLYGGGKEFRSPRDWQDLTGNKLLHTLVGHQREVLAVAFAPDGKLLASGDADGVIHVWGAADGRRLHRLEGHEGRVTSLAFSADGKLLASAGTLANPGGVGEAPADRVRLWDPAAGKALRELAVRGAQVAFTPAGGVVARGVWVYTGRSEEGLPFPPESAARVRFADPAAGKIRRQLEDFAGDMAVSRDGQLVATVRVVAPPPVALGGYGPYVLPSDRVQVWESATGKPVRDFPTREAPATALAFSPDGSRLASGRADGGVEVLGLAPAGWEPARARSLGPKELEGLCNDLALPDAGRAHEAVWTLAAAGDRAVALLKERVRPAPAPGRRVRQLIDDLNHEDFAVRKAAAEDLAVLGPGVEQELLRALEDRPPLETHRRLVALLDALRRQDLTPEQVRAVRAVRVLERVGSHDARALLEALAGGGPQAPLTQEARAALERVRATGGKKDE
jgi:WD40 repeat protein